MKRIETISKLPERPHNGHKGLFGRVLVVGGSEDMLGAPVLAGTAALRMGSGLVQIALPKSVLATALSITPELIGLSLGSRMTELIAAAKKSDAIVLGPGIGQSAAAKARVLRLIQLEKSMVIDADALNILSARKNWPQSCKARAVLTPHPGEMKRLMRAEIPTDDEGRIGIATLAAKEFEQIIVLKGARTVVTDGSRVFVNNTGDSSLSKAGTGDVLSGMIGSLIGQKMELFEAACLAVHLHGRAGEIAGQQLGQRSVLARDVIDAIHEAIAEL